MGWIIILSYIIVGAIISLHMMMRVIKNSSNIREMLDTVECKDNEDKIYGFLFCTKVGLVVLSIVIALFWPIISLALLFPDMG